MKQLVFVSLENWDDVWRRNQFVCSEWIRRGERRILFVGLPRNVSYAVRKGRWAECFQRATYTVAGNSSITITHPLKLLPDTLSIGRWINQWMFRRHVRRVANRLGFDQPVLWLNPHYAVHMAGKMRESALVYDITDDWSELSQSARRRRLTISQDADLCRRADAVIVCSEKLKELKEPLAPGKVHLVPNGVDCSHYASVTEASALRIRRWKSPVLGYTGTLHPDRIDVDLLVRVADAFRDAMIVLIGPNFLSPADLNRLEQRSNVVIHPSVAYSELPKYMQDFDVCIVPHRVTPFTESLNPIKLWEYLAAGKAIVSTNVAGFRDFPDVVHIARNAGEFITAAQRALSEGDKLAEARKQIAKEHSWSKRVSQIEKIIAEVVHVKTAGRTDVASGQIFVGDQC